MSDETEKGSRKRHPAEGLEFDKQLNDLRAAAEEAIKVIDAEAHKPSAEQLLAEAVKVIEFYAYCQGVDGAIGHRARDFLAKLGR